MTDDRCQLVAKAHTTFWVWWAKKTRGSVGSHWACVAHLSFCFEETKYRTFHTCRCFLWQSSFKGEDFLEIDQSETRIAYGGHVC